MSVTDRPKDLPNFELPPVSEVILSVQFATLTELHSYHIGFLRERLLSRYPEISEQGPLPPTFETFGGAIAVAEPQVRFEAIVALPMPRFWFEGEDGSLLQVQQDRIIHNWRKQGEERVYPRYENLRREFEADVETFTEFLKDYHLGELRPNQSEISYINTIQLPDEVDPYAALQRVTSVWRASSSDVCEFEAATIQSRFVLRKNGDPFARMHVTLQPAVRVSTQSAVLRMDLVVRGKPAEESIAAAFAFFDEGRAAIVKSFADLTTPEMHKLWGRTDG